MKYWITALISAVLISAIGNFAYFTLTHEYHAFAMTKEQPLMELIMLNHVVYVAMLVYLYPYFVKAQTAGVRKGAWFGLCMGIVMFVPSGLITRGAWEVPITFFFPIDIVFTALLSALMGMVIAGFYNKFSAKSA